MDCVLDLLTRGTLCTEVGTRTTGIKYSAELKNYLLTNNWDTSLIWQLWNWTVIIRKKILLTKQVMWLWTAQRNCSVLLNNQRGTETVFHLCWSMNGVIPKLQRKQNSVFLTSGCKYCPIFGQVFGHTDFIWRNNHVSFSLYYKPEKKT